PIGSYTLKEVKKPDGYASSEDIRFEITRETAYLEIPAVGKVLAIPVGNRPIQVDISKKAMTGDEELPGASLRVIDKATGTVADEWVSGETAHRIEHLTAGRTYILRETIAPDGYAVASDIEFTLSDTGEVQTVVMRDEMIEIPSETTAVTNQPEITTIHHAPEKTTATTAGLTTTAPSGATAVLTEHEPSENPLSGLSEPSVSPEAPTTASEKTVPAPLRTPRTGENAPRLLAGAGLIIAAGIIIAILLRETRHKEKRT
ncbi:MAG TPA: prealbumin-like fold domain-containing protein, partial [Bacillota bacterium]|nr:prealbumin-like fold domain-containing protein [Bacillota bacterium]